MIAEEQWYQNPIVIVAVFAFITEGLRRLAAVRDSKVVRLQKLEDEKSRKIEKAEDEKLAIDKEDRYNARTDEVAAHAAEAARLLAIASTHVSIVAEKAQLVADKTELVAIKAEEAAALLVESNKRVQERDSLMSAKLDETIERTRHIEASTDGQYTAMLKNQIITLEAYKLSEERFLAGKAEKGHLPTTESINVLAAIQGNIDSLKQEVADRDEALSVVKEQIKTEKDSNNQQESTT